MATQSTNPISLPKEDPIIANLKPFITAHKIKLSPSLAFRRVPGRGLGIYSKEPLCEGERIMHVPAATLLTPASVPVSFAAKELRAKLPVHVLLTAYIAFGLTEEKKAELRPWTDTWPQVEDFTGTMPLFWPEATRTPVTVTLPQDKPSGGHLISDTRREGQKEDATSSDAEEITFHPLPPSLTGSWLSSASMTPTPPKPLDQQLTKFQSHLSLLTTHFPSYFPATLAQSSSEPTQAHTSLIHAWSNVNTRCFYHTLPGARAPKDSNEAMALVPIMDLFNHASTPNCRTSYDRKGFSVTAIHDIPDAGTELLLSYGSHGNDMLWTEYGFIIPEAGNTDDSLSGFDEIVLQGLGESERETLKQAGYLGDYSLTPAPTKAFCWRGEVVSWLRVLSRNQWFRFIAGSLETEVADRVFLEKMNERKGKAKRRKGNDAAVLAVAGSGPDGGDRDDESELPSVRASKKQMSWLTQMKVQAENALEGLLVLGEAECEDQMLAVFANSVEMSSAQPSRTEQNEMLQLSQANLRHGFCLMRWLQIFEICYEAVVRLQQGLPQLSRDAEDHKRAEMLRRRARNLIEQR